MLEEEEAKETAASLCRKNRLFLIGLQTRRRFRRHVVHPIVDLAVQNDLVRVHRIAQLFHHTRSIYISRRISVRMSKHIS
ncbi:hypothetical protein B2M20_14750 [Nitrobacter vulgaris]|uniref:Uncharacterized protein n=1 Tax=Nitrobacter vulgaris TaxID=29421 RepID=A0A1V4HVK8_NITVU|nr:hypothetical protein B2M20_14750 [Nitrobacter vulgaris]